MNCTDPEVKHAFDKAARMYKEMPRNPDGTPVNPNYIPGVNWECMQSFKVSGPFDSQDVLKMPPVVCAFQNLLNAETSLEAGGSNMAALVRKVTQARERVLAQVHRCMTGNYRPGKRSGEGEPDGAGPSKAARV